MKHYLALCSFFFLVVAAFAERAEAKVTISPFVSIGSTKSVKPSKTKGKEDETIKQRTTYGIMGSLSFFRLLSLQASVGQSELITTTKSQNAVDEYGEIDFKEDLDTSTDDPDKEMKITDIQRKGRVGLAIDPGFWIIILRAKAGVQATQRTVAVEETGKAKVTTTPPITYKPYAGAGAGVRLSPRMFFMAEYSLFLYQFPKTAPFEREVTVSFGVSI